MRCTNSKLESVESSTSFCLHAHGARQIFMHYFLWFQLLMIFGFCCFTYTYCKWWVDTLLAAIQHYSFFNDYIISSLLLFTINISLNTHNFLSQLLQSTNSGFRSDASRATRVWTYVCVTLVVCVPCVVWCKLCLFDFVVPFCSFHLY